MQRWLVVAAVAGVLACGVQADPVAPIVLTGTNLTDDAAISDLSSATYIQGDSLLLTNWVMYTGSSTSSPLQNLDGCAITVTMGDTTTVTNQGASISTNAGTWWALIPAVPAFNPCYIEISVSNGAKRTYGREKIKTRAALGN